MVVNYGTKIFLLSLCKEPQDRMFFIDSLPGHEILVKTIDLFLTKTFNVTYSAQPSLSFFQTMLAAYFYELNTNPDYLEESDAKYPHWKELILCFFYHLFVLPNEEGTIFKFPLLIRMDNRIFLELYGQYTFAPEVLSILTEKEYPLIFEYIRRDDTSNPLNPSFRKYLVQEYNGHEYLLIPEIPLNLRRQLTNFYAGLLETFNTLTFTDEFEKTEASYVKDYLLTIRNFLGPENEFNNLNKLSWKMVADYGPYIVLISLSSELKEYNERFFFLNSFPSHRILAQAIHLCLTQRLGVICEEPPSLQIFQTKLAAYFIQINTDEGFGPHFKEATHWEMLFRWFFIHLFSFDAKSENISPDHILFRQNNRIFMYIRPECNPKFPPEVLTTIAKTEYPRIFELLEQTDDEFLIPELPLDFRMQLYRFYDMLIEFYPLAKVEGDEDEATRKTFYLENDIIYNPKDSEANHVLEYLVGLRDFLGPN